MSIAQRLSRQVLTARIQPSKLVVSSDDAKELAQFFHGMRRLPNEHGETLADLKRMIQEGRSTFMGIPVEVAA